MSTRTESLTGKEESLRLEDAKVGAELHPKPTTLVSLTEEEYQAVPLVKPEPRGESDN